MSRFENEDQQRRDRARAHLARTRNRRTETRVVWKKREENAPEKRRRATPRELAIVLAASALLGLVVGDGWPVFARDLIGSSPTQLTRIAVLGANRLTPESVARATGVAPGAALSEVDEQDIEAMLIAQPWIEDASAARLPGGSLVVSVDERIPAATTLAGDAGQRFGVDASGHIFAPLEAGDLPHLVVREALAPGSRDARLARAIEISAQLPERGLALPMEIEVAGEEDPSGFTLHFAGLDTEFVLGRDDLPERLDRLSRLLALRPAEVARAARVDLRFEDQVVLQKEAARNGSLRNATSRGYAAPRETRQAG
jgi:cell division septal protein FtsQ